MNAAGMWGLAIDFGTTATSAATCDADGFIAPLAMPDGALAIPSSVCADGDELLVGRDADNQAHYRLDSYEPTPKRRVGQSRVLLGDNEYEPSALIGAVLSAVLLEALNQHDRRVPGSLVLTHPVAWRSSRRQVLNDALRNAAAAMELDYLPEPVFVSEPVAAAHGFARPDPSREGQHFAVYDLGGGTFDTAVLQQSGAGFEVLASGGIDPLGGFDFDYLLFTYLGNTKIGPADPELWAALSTADPDDPSARSDRRLMQTRVRYLKEQLTTRPSRKCRLPGLQTQVLVTVDEYNQLISDRIDETVAELEATISRADLGAGQISAIYQIGGAARTPLVGAALNRLRLRVHVQENPKLVVAQGGARVAHRTLPIAVYQQAGQTNHHLARSEEWGGHASAQSRASQTGAPPYPPRQVQSGLAGSDARSSPMGSAGTRCSEENRGTQSDPAAGWYADPWKQAPLRWWDGSQWTGATTQPTPSGRLRKDAHHEARRRVRGKAREKRQHHEPASAKEPTRLGQIQTDLVVVRGTARSVQQRSVGEEAAEEISSFRVERCDSMGNQLPPVPVEVEGDRIHGRLSDGDEVEVSGTWEAGTLRAGTFFNVSTHVRARSSWDDMPIVGKTLVVTFAVVMTILTCGIAPVVIAPIVYFVFRSRSMVRIPDVAGHSSADAHNLLHAAGLNTTTQQSEEWTLNNQLRSGEVIRTEPPAGTKARRDTPITIVMAGDPGNPANY